MLSAAVLPDVFLRICALQASYGVMPSSHMSLLPNRLAMILFNLILCGKLAHLFDAFKVSYLLVCGLVRLTSLFLAALSPVCRDPRMEVHGAIRTYVGVGGVQPNPVRCNNAYTGGEVGSRLWKSNKLGEDITGLGADSLSFPPFRFFFLESNKRRTLNQTLQNARSPDQQNYRQQFPPSCKGIK